jgi:hypothetical protein
VFEHFHRHHPIELPGVDLERVHVAGHHPNPVLQTAFSGLGLDVSPLRAGIGDRRDTAVWVVLSHPQRKGAPAASEFQNRLPVHQARMQTGLTQTGGFCLV